MAGLRIVFMGTPEFAVPSLKILVDNGVDIAGVITAPDKPQGRGKKIGESAIKTYSKSEGLNILQPANLKDESFLKKLKKLNADLQVVVAFRMLPDVVWQMPELGTFNLHASLLPQYRGAAPINWAIMNGEKETGVTTFFLKREIDTGNILFQQKEKILEEDNVGSLYGRLMDSGAKLVFKTVKAIESGNYAERPQKIFGELKKAPKIFKENCEIDWKKSAEEIRNFVRGLSPYPGAWTNMHGHHLKVFDVLVRKDAGSRDPGLFEKQDQGIIVNSADNKLELLEIQLEGKKRMKASELLRGYRWPS